MQTLPVGGPYQKDDLISQINSHPDRADQLIGEIESMEGNAGAIVGAITEVCTVDACVFTGYANPNRSCTPFATAERRSR